MVNCSVETCRSNSNRKSGKSEAKVDNNSKIRFFAFPKDEKLQKIWIEKCQRKVEFNIKNGKICSLHFVEEDYPVKYRLTNYSLYEKKELNPGAIPSQNLPNTDEELSVNCILCKDFKFDLAFKQPRIMHEFPKRQILLKKWLTFCETHGAETNPLPKTAHLCSMHFTDDDYTILDASLSQNNCDKLLNRNAVPSISLEQLIKLSRDKTVEEETRKRKELVDQILNDYVPEPPQAPLNALNEGALFEPFVQLDKPPAPLKKRALFHKPVVSNDPCSVMNCASSGLKWQVKYFKLPQVDLTTSESNQLINRKRREAWLEVIPLKCPSIEQNLISICSEHFVFGKPADEFNYCNVDWVPSVNLIKSESDRNEDPLLEDSQSELNEEVTKALLYEHQFKPFKANIGEWIFGRSQFESKIEKIKETPKLLIFVKKMFTPILSEKPVITTDGKSCVCGMKFLTPNDLLRHSSSACTFCKCYVCYQDFQTKDDLHQHFKSHQIKRSFTCEHCLFPLNLSTVEQMQHLRIVDHIAEKNFVCDICAKFYPTSHELEYHMKLEHVQGAADLSNEDLSTPNSTANDSRKICDICGITFSKLYFPFHMKNHSKRKPYKCELCNASFKLGKYLAYHTESHMKNQRNCPYCDKEFLGYKSFVKHVNNHPATEFPPIKCDLCRKRFYHRVLYDEHVKSFHRHYECYICNRQFEKFKFLKGHISLHKKNNLINESDIFYRCKLCDKKTRSKVKITMHAKTHTQLKVFTCNICNKSFCGMEADEISHRRGHLKIDEINRCDLCPLAFDSNTEFIKHLYDVHNVSLNMNEETEEEN